MCTLGPSRLRLWNPKACARFISQAARPEPVRPLAYDLHEPARPKTPDAKQAPIIFLHGLFGSKKNNRGISKCSRALARDLGRWVYALDLRNHGQSPHDPRHDYRAMAEDVAAFIHDHGLSDAAVVGHSIARPLLSPAGAPRLP